MEVRGPMSDIIIKNAGYIIDNSLKIYKNSSIIIEDNIITEIGKKTTLPAPEYEIDAKWKLVVPAFINAHTHTPMTLLRGYCDDRRLWDWLSEIWKAENYFDRTVCKIGAELAILEMIKNGIGLFADFYFHQDVVAEISVKAGLRAILGSTILGEEFVQQGGNEFLFEQAKKTIQLARTSELLLPAIAPHSPVTVPQEDLQKSLELAQKNNAFLMIHVSETRDDVLKSEDRYGKPPIEWLNSFGFLNYHKTFFVHGVWITDREVRLLGEHRNGFVYCPVSAQKLAYGGVPPIPELLKNGVNVMLGTDGPASNNVLDILQEMKFASLLISFDRWDPSMITVKDIFQMASVTFRKSYLPNTGLQQYAFADMTLINFRKPHLYPINEHRILSHLVFSATGHDCTDLIINGKPIMIAKKPLTLNEEKIMDNAQNTWMQLEDQIKSETQISN